MEQRLVEIYLPEECKDLPALEEENVTIDKWVFPLENGRTCVRVLLVTEQTESFLAWIDEALKDSGEFRIVVSNVEASLPRAVSPRKDHTLSEEKRKKAGERAVSRISREELHQDLATAISGMRVYIALVALSTVVAAGGMLRDSVAIVVGAMVIAPLIGPNIAAAFATTTGDLDFLGRAVLINAAGLMVGLALSVLAGTIFLVDPTTPEIANRLIVHWSDIILALSAGAAGSLAFTRGASVALIGVMVAVALLPPLVAVGLMMGIGEWYAAYSAGLLVLVNVTCINLAAVVTFLLQGIRPRDWFRVEEARQHTRLAILLWFIVLCLLGLAIFLATRPPILE